MAFISGESTSQQGVQYYHVFVPTTPNPTSGFFLLIPQSDSIKTGMSVEDGLKTIISGGLLCSRKKSTSINCISLCIKILVLFQNGEK